MFSDHDFLASGFAINEFRVVIKPYYLHGGLGTEMKQANGFQQGKIFIIYLQVSFGQASHLLHITSTIT